MPRTEAAPGGPSFARVLSEQQQLRQELAAEKAAREAAEACALVSADEAAAAVRHLSFSCTQCTLHPPEISSDLWGPLAQCGIRSSSPHWR